MGCDGIVLAAPVRLDRALSEVAVKEVCVPLLLNWCGVDATAAGVAGRKAASRSGLLLDGKVSGFGGHGPFGRERGRISLIHGALLERICAALDDQDWNCRPLG